MSNAFKIAPEVLVEHSGERFLVVEIADVENAMCRRLSSNETLLLPITELIPARETKLIPDVTPAKLDLASLDSETWNEVSERLEVLRELHALGRHRRTKEQIENAGKRLGKSTQTIYRWLKKFESDSSVSGMLRQERSDKGLLQFNEEVERLIQDALNRIMFKREAGTIKDVHTDVKMACQARNLKVPGKTAIRDRYMAIPEKARVAGRKGTRAAKERFTPLRGSFPGADHPLDVIQIDHTPADLIIVDEIYRKPIGRPTLTIAVDVAYSGERDRSFRRT
jgi:putative transposase